MDYDDYNKEAKIIEAFKLMWSKYPEPAMLINRGKKVMALNWACRQAGPSVGSFCHEIGGCQDLNKSCLIHHCLETRQASRLKVDDGKKQWTIHWVPVDGHPDFCVHFFSGSGD